MDYLVFSRSTHFATSVLYCRPILINGLVNSIVCESIIWVKGKIQKVPITFLKYEIFKINIYIF